MQYLGESAAGRYFTCGVTFGTTESAASREQGAAETFMDIAEEIGLRVRRHGQSMRLAPPPQLDKTDTTQRIREKYSLGEEPVKRRKSRMKCDWS